jgi:hypothetical protein
MKIGNIDLEEFRSGEIAVNCVTEDDALEFVGKCFDNGIIWGCASSAKITYFYMYESDICFRCEDQRFIRVGGIEHQKVKIIKYEGAKEMKFSDLKDNWVVIIRDSKVLLVKSFRLYTAELKLERYNEDLTHETNKINDIMKVYSTDNGELTLVWERKEPTEKEKNEQIIIDIVKEAISKNKGGLKEMILKSVEGMK